MGEKSKSFTYNGIMILNKTYLQTTQIILILTTLISAWVIEIVYALSPCPICWMQRSLLLMLLICISIEWRTKTSFGLSLCTYIMLTLGILLNLHHQYLINNYDPNASCLPGFDYLINTFGVFKALHLIFTDHSSSCGNVVFTWFGLNIPDLLMLIYITLIGINLIKSYSKPTT